MGLLDDLYIGHNANFGGQGGGLLDFLRTSQMQQDQYQPSAGFPQPSPLDNAQWPYGPNNGPSALDNAQWPSGPVGAAPANFADRFNAMPGAPQPFQGAGRSFDNATFDPSTYAPNQAQPIAVGNYQMPRIGTADQFIPPMNAQAAIPPNAQPTQGQLPQQAPPMQAMQAPQQQTPPTFLNNEGGLGAGLRGFVNNLHAGPLGAIIGGLGSAAGMQSPAQQNLKAQFDSLRQSLIENGETPQAANSKAMLAVMNPEAAKTVLPELLTNREQFKVIKDGFGGERPAFVNERAQTINGKTIDEYYKQGGGQGGQEVFDAIAKARDGGAKPDQLYQLAPPQLREGVRAMIEGRALPAHLSARGDARNQTIALAHTIDPTFDESQIAARVQGNKDFYGGGKSSEMVRAANQTLGHVNSLMDSMDALKNRGMPAWNAVANTVSEQFGTGEQGSFRTNAHAVAEEMSKVFKGANLSDSEIRHWEQNLSENMSPTQQRAQIAKLSELLHGSLTALDKKRVDSMGPVAAAKAPPLIGEEGQKVLKRVDEWVKGNAAPAQSTGVDRSAIEAEMRKRGLLK